MIIDLTKECGEKTITRQDGKMINNMILEAWNKEKKITIDFRNILIASVSFLDEAFGQLTFEKPKERLMEKLAFTNLNEYDRALLNDILISRYHQKDLKQNGVSRRSKKNRSLG